MDGVPFAFVSREPDGDLARFVESVWFARGWIGYRRERIAPTGSCVAVIVLGAPIIATSQGGSGTSFTAATGYLIGPHNGPVLNEPTGETFAAGIVTTPVGCRSVFGLDPASIRGAVVDLGTAWPQLAAIRPRLLAESDPAAVVDLLTAHLREQLDPDVAGVDRCAAALATLDARPTIEIRELAAMLGVSNGFLDREFVRVVGLTPHAVARIARLRRVLAGVDVFGEVNWTRIAAEAGWFDQSHFIRDFKRHTGVTPSAYLRSQRAAYTASDAAAGFVPEL